MLQSLKRRDPEVHSPELDAPRRGFGKRLRCPEDDTGKLSSSHDTRLPYLNLVVPPPVAILAVFPCFLLTLSAMPTDNLASLPSLQDFGFSFVAVPILTCCNYIISHPSFLGLKQVSAANPL